MIVRKLTSANQLLYGNSDKGLLARPAMVGLRSTNQQLRASSLSELTRLLQEIYEELPAESANKKLVVEVSSLAAVASASANRGEMERAKEEVVEAIEYLKRHPGWP